MLRKCDADRARKIDLLFLSVGGNDVGFARLVANAVLADQSILRKLGGWFGQVHGFAEASSQLDALDDRLKSVNRALHNLLHVPWSESDRIILTGYPPMALLDDGKTVCPDGQAGMNVMSEFSLSEAKAREGSVAAERLNDIMRESAHQHLWTFVDGHRAAFRGRGLCAGYSDAPWTMADELRVPRKINGAWEPFNPSQWRAYAPRQRLFRTPNDAYMTGNFHVAQSLHAEGAEQAGLRLGAAAAGERLFRRLSSRPPRARRRSRTPSSPRPAACSPSTRSAPAARPAASIWASSMSPTSVEAASRCCCTQRRIRANRLVFGHSSSRCAADRHVRTRCITARSVPATAAPTR